MADITWPAGLVPSSTSMTLIENTAAFENPLTGTIQTLERPGARWSQSLSFNAMTGADRAELQAFLASLRGQANRAVLPVFGHTNRGVGGGTPLVAGASQTGSSLNTDGWTASTVVLRAGDFFSVNGELKMVTADCVSDASGNATIQFAPILRASPADNAPLRLGAVSTTELLTNGGFETGATTPWAVDSGGSSLTAVSSGQRTGSYAGRVTLAVNASSIVVKQDLATTPGRRLLATAYVRRSETSVPNRPLSLYLRFGTSGSSLISAPLIATASESVSGWQRLTGVAEVPATTANVSFRLQKGGTQNTDESGDWFFDDCSLVSMPWPSAKYVIASPSYGWSNAPWTSGPISEFQLEFIESFA